MNMLKKPIPRPAKIKAGDVSMPFGKYSDMPIKEVPSGYLRWVVEQHEDGKFEQYGWLINSINEEMEYRDASNSHWEEEQS